MHVIITTVIAIIKCMRDGARAELERYIEMMRANNRGYPELFNKNECYDV